MTRRRFPKSVKTAAFERAMGRCECCTAYLYVGKFHYDHIQPDGLLGEPTLENCRVLCIACHGVKTAREDIPRMAKADRQKARHEGTRKPSRRPMDGSRGSRWRKRMDGTVERR